MNTPYKRSVAALAIFAALAGAPLPAGAESGVRIRFRDFDLSTPEGIAALYQRIERGARLVCRDSSAPWDAGSVRTFQRCHEAAVDDAVATINQPRLTALHLEKSGRAAQEAAATGTCSASLEQAATRTPAMRTAKKHNLRCQTAIVPAM